MADHTKAEAHLLRHDEPAPRRSCASTSAPAAARCVLEDGHQRPHDHALRQRRAHAAALDAPDPGDARGPGDAQRAERDVRRRRWPTRWASSSRTSATACARSTRTFFQAPGRMNVFDEHPVQGDPRLRPQPGGGAGDGRAGRAARRARAAASCVLAAPGRPPRRGHRARWRAIAAARTSTTSSCERDDDLRGREPRRGAQLMRGRRCSRPASRASGSRSSRRAGGGRRGARAWRSPATCCSSSPTTSPAAGSRSSISAAIRRLRHLKLRSRSEHPSHPTSCRRSRSSPSCRRRAALVRDERGVRLARDPEEAD